MSFESTTATLDAVSPSPSDPSLDPIAADFADSPLEQPEFPFPAPSLSEEDIVELELFNPDDEPLDPQRSYGALPGTIAAVILHVWFPGHAEQLHSNRSRCSRRDAGRGCDRGCRG